MTGRPDAAWGTLAAGERNQVAVLMSLLTHESALAAVQAPPVALDPEGRKAAFSYVDAAHAAGSGSGGARAKAGARKQAQVRDKVWSHPKAALPGGRPVDGSDDAEGKPGFARERTF